MFVKLVSFLYRTIKGIYDILATYLLLFILPFALAAFAIHLGLEAAAHLLEFATLDEMWTSAADTLGVRDTWLRIIVVLPVHVLLFVVLRRPVAWAQPTAEKIFDAFVRAFRKVFERLPRAQAVLEFLFSISVTVLLIPFVIQPTLVYGYGTASWAERAANLLDGTASAAIADSVVGLYRRFYAEPVVVKGVDGDAVDDAIDTQEQDPGTKPPPIPVGKQPLMDRWDPVIAKYAGGDPHKFAMIKAFMYVESAGRQFAVSHTGCAGLMQFCAGTARSRPFKEIFGTGQIYVCGCQTKDCSIPRDVQRDLESGDPEAIERHRQVFPCELTDARFNPDKIIHAGGAYVDRLRNAYGGNVYLMYIGYNSGPGIANRVWKKLGKRPEATLAEIEVHLADAMRPTYRAGSDRRAASLVRTHLPKIKKAYDRYLAAQVGGRPPVPVPAVPATPGENRPATTAPTPKAKPPRQKAIPARETTPEIIGQADAGTEVSAENGDAGITDLDMGSAADLGGDTGIGGDEARDMSAASPAPDVDVAPSETPDVGVVEASPDLGDADSGR